MRLKKVLSIIICISLIFGFVIFGIQTQAEAAASSLTVSVGYFGLPFVEKAVYSISDMYSIGVESAMYTMNTNGGFLAYADAEGTYLSDILYAADVNVSAISHFNFYAYDGWNATSDYSYSRLLGGGKYAFPNLSEYYGKYEGVTNYDAVWESAVSVSTMLAIYDNYNRVSDFSEYVPVGMDSNHCFRLMIGQEYPGQIVASDSIYGIHTILVTYEGFPEINADSEIEVGLNENMTLDVSVSSADSEISSMIARGLKYKSNDTSVVKVDENGKLTAVGKGEAEITIYFEATDIDGSNVSKTVKVVVGDDENSNGGGSGGTGNGLGDGDGNGSGGSGGGSENSDGGTGNGDGSGTGNGVGDNNQKPSDGDKPSTGGNDNKNDSSEDGSNGDSNDKSNTDSNKDENKNDKTDDNNQGSQKPNDKPDTDNEAYVTDKPIDTTLTGEVKLPDKDNDISDTGGTVHTLSVRKIKSGNGSAGGIVSDSGGGAEGGTDGGSAALGLTLEKNPMLIIAAVISILLFLSGGFGMYIKYKRDIREDYK